MMDDATRASLETRIMQRLQRLDTSVLHELDAWLMTPEAGDGTGEAVGEGGMTRRQMLSAGVLGGAAVVGVGGAATVLGRRVGVEEGVARFAGANETIGQLQSETARLDERFASARELIGMYEQLDAIDLDTTVSSGMSVVAAALASTAGTAQRVREGLVVARNNINQLDEGLAILDQGLAGVEGTISGLSGLVQRLEDTLRSAGQPVAPLAEALGGFLSGIIRRIPGVGDQIVDTFARLQSLIDAVPESVENINRDLIEPLRTRFFPREGDTVSVRLLEPLTDLLFTPVDRVLAGLGTLAETWQSALEAPAQEKIAARDEVRKQLLRVRQEKQL